MTRVPFLHPTFPTPAEIAEEFAAISARGIFSNGGPVEARFTKQLGQWIGNGVSVSCLSNATAALELALQVLVQPQRPTVLVPSFTFAAGALAIRRNGFTPVFIDVDLHTWQPSLEDAAAAFDEQSNVGGILLTSTFGVANPDIKQWEAFARDRRIPLIVDSAAGFGSVYSWGEPLGSRGDCELFSFHATKMLAIGEGGALASRSPDVLDSVNQLKNFGFNDEREAVMAGTNAKLNELAAAIGLHQLRALPARIKARQQIVALYKAALKPMGFEFQVGAELCAPSFVSALAPSKDHRDALADALLEDEVECRTYYNPPVHRHPVFSSIPDRPLPATTEISGRIVSLPIADTLAPEVIERVAAAAQVAARV
jgi:dTDP-4-amino-4,6-dideoxygalactose transaminase